MRLSRAAVGLFAVLEIRLLCNSAWSKAHRRTLRVRWGGVTVAI